MAFAIILIMAIALLRILIPLAYAFLLTVWIVVRCIIETIRNEIEERRVAKEWREAQRENK
jgi:hypothetical protein